MTDFSVQDLLEAKDVTGLLQALEEGDSLCREMAARALGKLSDRGAVDGLIVALANKNMDVRVAAAVALGEIGDSRAVGPLVEALNDTTNYQVIKVPLRVPSSNIDARGGAALALGKIGGDAAIEALQAFSESAGETGVYFGLSVAEAVQKALAEMEAGAGEAVDAPSRAGFFARWFGRQK